MISLLLRKILSNTLEIINMFAKNTRLNKIQYEKMADFPNDIACCQCAGTTPANLVH